MKDGVILIDIPESCQKCRFRGSDEFRCEEGVILEGIDAQNTRAGRCPIKRFDFDFAITWAERFADQMSTPQQVVKTPKRSRKLKRKKAG